MTNSLNLSRDAHNQCEVRPKLVISEALTAPIAEMIAASGPCTRQRGGEQDSRLNRGLPEHGWTIRSAQASRLMDCLDALISGIDMISEALTCGSAGFTCVSLTSRGKYA